MCLTEELPIDTSYSFLSFLNFTEKVVPILLGWNDCFEVWERGQRGNCPDLFYLGTNEEGRDVGGIRKEVDENVKEL